MINIVDFVAIAITILATGLVGGALITFLIIIMFDKSGGQDDTRRKK